MKNNFVEVSVIVCGYNGETTLAAALDSALAQTLDAVEIVCVNDGSTDRTLEVFRSYAEKHPRIKVIDHPGNKGLLAARQTGVNNASGKYIMFLDQDDLLRPEACLELVRAMNETGSDIIQFDTELVYCSEELRQPRGNLDSDYFALRQTKTLCNSDEIIRSCFLKREFPWNVWSKIWKTELVRKIYSFLSGNMNVVMAEDTFAFFLGASMAKKLSFIPKKYYIYSAGSGVSGDTTLEKSESSLQVYYSLIKPYAVQHPSEVVRKASETLRTFFQNCILYKLLDISTIKSCKTIVEREIRSFGLAAAALTFIDGWNILGMHPLKPAFLGYAASLLSRPVNKIRKLGVFCTGLEISTSLAGLISDLCDAGMEVRLFVRNDISRSVTDGIEVCQVTVLPEDHKEIAAFLNSPVFQKESDACILSYGPDPDYDLTAFLLFCLRLAGSLTVFAFLEQKIEQLNCHDKIFLSATDCVLNDSPTAAALFGNLGVIAGSRCKCLEKIISSFEGNGSETSAPVQAARERMAATAVNALAMLGYAEFGRNTSLDTAVLKKNLAAAGWPCSVEDYCLMRESGFFDDEYYKKQFPGQTIKDPIFHFCKVGLFQLAAPSAIFDPKQYCIVNPDLFPVQMNWVVHYLRYGIQEGRKFHSSIADRIRHSGYFDEISYRREHGPELGPCDPLMHYLLVGWKKGYLASERFVDKYYSACYVGFEQNQLNPLYHYIRWGKDEGRCPFPLTPRIEKYFPEGYDAEAFWKRKGKYLVVVHQLDFTGVPILSKMVAEIFSEEKSAAIITPMDGPLRDACVKAGIPVLVDSDFYVHQERASFYREKGFGVCLFNTLGLIKVFLRNAGRIPSVLWIHDNLPKSFLSQAVQVQIQYAPVVFATSKMTRDMVREYNPGVRYLPYPVKDMGGHHKTTVPERIRFGVMGVYRERKGQDLAIEAFKNLPAPLKEKAELMLFGDAVQPEYAKRLEAMAIGEEHIHFIPAKKDTAVYHQLYENLEVQICPSRTDPMPLVVFDGMMHGCPEILSDTVGQSEFIRNGENGFVFPSGNPTALRDCMVRILEEPERFINMSQSSRQTFLDNAEFNKVSGIIRQVLDEVKTYF